MKVAVTGSTGQLGQIVVEKLKKKLPQENLVAMARSAEKAAGLGVPTRIADYEQPEAILQALTGIDTLILISASDFNKRADHHHNIVEAARKADIKWIIYTSLIHADTSTIGLAAQHRTTEAEIKNSGIPFTILRNGWYTENYVGSIQAAVNTGSIIGSSGNGKISSASREDYADAIVSVLTASDQDGKTYELAGDESWTLSDLASEISKQTGKDITYVDMPEEQYASALTNYGFPEFLANAFAEWDARAAEGELFDDNRELSQLIKRPTTPFSVVVTQTIEALRAG